MPIFVEPNDQSLYHRSIFDKLTAGHWIKCHACKRYFALSLFSFSQRPESDLIQPTCIHCMNKT